MTAPDRAVSGQLERFLVILPTYNERENLAQVVPAILDQDPRLEVLVVDDNSPDGTGELADLLLEAQAVGASAATAPGCVAGVSTAAVEELLGSQGEVVRNHTRVVSRKGSPS